MTLDERERSGSSAKLAREKRGREGEREGVRWKERERERGTPSFVEVPRHLERERDCFYHIIVQTCHAELHSGKIP